jgi:restriction endonuclease S subunit
LKNIAIGRTINILRPSKKNIYSQKYIAYYINHQLKTKIASLSKGSSISNVYNSDLKKLKIPLPPLKEQEKIAEILTTWDEAITKQTELLRAKKLQKKALMQKLLSGEVRFDGFDDEWEEVRLGEIVKKMQSGGTPKADNQEFYNGNIPFVKVNDITSSGKYLIKTESSITEKGLKNSSAWIVPINSIIYSMYASVGFLSINTIEVATSQAMINIILDLEKANLEYIYYHLLDFKKNVHTYVETGTQGNLNAQTVRNLRRVFSKLFRKVVKQILNDATIEKVTIGTKDLKAYLDNPIFEIDPAEKKNSIGIANGLAWTAVGGDVLKIEAIKLKGKGNLTVTGNLGDVMKESSRISYSVVKVLIDNKVLKIDEKIIPKSVKEEEENEKLDCSEIYKRYDIHLHIPEGATPKDGPSAGITMALAIASILSDKAIKADVAMTGELTLSGKVLPIGGLKEKLIAAYKAKMKKALVPRKNFDRDLDEIPDEVKNAMEIKAVDTIEDVLKEALV